jgi:hypothetical protein
MNDQLMVQRIDEWNHCECYRNDHEELMSCHWYHCCFQTIVMMNDWDIDNGLMIVVL